MSPALERPLTPEVRALLGGMFFAKGQVACAPTPFPWPTHLLASVDDPPPPPPSFGHCFLPRVPFSERSQKAKVQLRD